MGENGVHGPPGKNVRLFSVNVNVCSHDRKGQQTNSSKQGVLKYSFDLLGAT
jgi:hypothetical protein